MTDAATTAGVSEVAAVLRERDRFLLTAHEGPDGDALGSMLGLFHARKLRAHEIAIKLGWDRVHKALGLTDRFYRWFTPAISSSDFSLKSTNLDTALDFIAVCRLA